MAEHKQKPNPAPEPDRNVAEIGSSEAGTKEKIIDAARAEFAENGFEGARVDRIADRAGVNKAMLYYHFRSKEFLYQDVVTSFFRHVFTQLLARTSEGKTLEEYLLGVLETHIQAYRQTPDFVRILLRELASPHDELMEMLAGAIRDSQFPEQTARRFKQAMDAGEFRKFDPQQALVSLIMMSLGYLLMAPLADRVWGIQDRLAFLEKRKYAIVDLFMHGVLAR